MAKKKTMAAIHEGRARGLYAQKYRNIQKMFNATLNEPVTPSAVGGYADPDKAFDSLVRENERLDKRFDDAISLRDSMMNPEKKKKKRK